MPQLNPAKRSTDEVRILSVDGGGNRGILPARILQEIEKRTQRKAADLFHLMAGTSTGGIIACGLAAGMAGKALGDLYAARGARIFAAFLCSGQQIQANWRGPKYSAEVLDGILNDALGQTSLRDVGSTELLIPTYVIELSKPQMADGVVSTRTPMFFKTWAARGMASPRINTPMNIILRSGMWHGPLLQLLLIFRRRNRELIKEDTFGVVDGGVFANNPSLCALASAYKLYPGAKFTLVSLGTGSLERDITYGAAKHWGDLHWLHPILSILMDGNADSICYQCDQVLRDRHKQFQNHARARSTQSAIS